MEDKCCINSRKPFIPPKPKSLTKPSPPPKPPDLCSLPKSTPKNISTPKKSFLHSSIASVSSDLKSSNDTPFVNSSLIQLNLTRETSTHVSRIPIVINSENSNLRNSSNSDGHVLSVCSSDSNSSTDVHQDSLLDGFDKLSDVDTSERSTSISPIHLNHSSFLYPSSCAPTSVDVKLDFNSFDVCSNSVECTNINNSSSDESSDSFRTKVFNIVNEIYSSENVFCNVLKLLNEKFRQFIIESGHLAENSKTVFKSGSLISKEELDRILNYLPQLQNFSEGLLQDLKDRLANWDQHEKIADIFVTKGPFLKMYSSYIKDFEHQCKLLDEACDHYPSFEKSVHKFETSDICGKLCLKHYMLKPVQRIPQYKLLFQSYIKLLPSSSPDYVDARKALSVLEEVAAHANETCKIEEKVTQLLSLQRRLCTADGGQPELIKPGRELLKQGELMKLCRREMQPRYFVLLSDGFLYTSYTSSSTTPLRLNAELPLEGMKVIKPTADDFSTELVIRATQRSFTLRAKSEKERDQWLESIQRAIDANILRRSTFNAASTASYTAPAECELGKQAPVWVPDYRVTMCQSCTAEFSLTFRRHHCRACGRVVCDVCSSNRAPLEYKKYRSERVCDSCYLVLLSALEQKIHSQAPELLDPEPAPNSDDPDEDNFKHELTLSDLERLRQSFKQGIRDSMRGKTMRKPERLLLVRGDDQGSQMRGYLKRQGKRGWFVLKERVLYHYAAPEDVCALDSLPVLGYRILDKSLDSAEPFFLLQHDNQDDIHFSAESLDLTIKWVTAMKDATVL